MNYKLTGIIVIMLLTVIGFSSAKNVDHFIKNEISIDETELKIDIVSNGFDVDYKWSEIFGVSAIIQNKGSVNATDVQWSISVDGGLVLLGKKTSGTIPIIFPGEISLIKIPIIVGFGKTVITITASALETNETTIQARARMAGLFVVLLPGTENSLKVRLEKVEGGLKAPVLLTNAGDDSDRLFVAEQAGKICIIKNGTLLSDPFLDLKDKMVKLQPFYDERGLLGLAFHPDYKNNSRFFVYYSAPTSTQGMNHQSIIAEYKVSSEDPDKADISSEQIIMSVDEPEFNHNGGQLAFGPDGYLYIGVGDGGSEGDPHGLIGNGQDINTSLGKILRIDVDHGTPYSVPADNPFVGIDGLDEIYAYGFRNPYRFSFDMISEKLFVADVGQDNWEEIDVVENGGNYGWRIMEGNYLFDPELATFLGIDIDSLSPPIHDYSHYVAHAIIGGYVYRGEQGSDLVGKYVFGDWSATYFQPRGKLYYLEENEPNVWTRMEFRLSDDKPLKYYIRAFGEDESGELYLITQKTPGPVLKTGEIWHIVLGEVI